MANLVDKSQTINNSVDTTTNRYGFCEGHFERGVNYTLKKIAYEPPDGDVEPTKWLCSDCIKKLEAHVKKEGGRICYK